MNISASARAKLILVYVTFVVVLGLYYGWERYQPGAVVNLACFFVLASLTLVYAVSRVVSQWQGPRSAKVRLAVACGAVVLIPVGLYVVALSSIGINWSSYQF